MKKPEKHPQTSSPEGYLLPNAYRGFSPAVTTPADYNQAANFMSGPAEDLELSGVIDIRDSYQGETLLKNADFETSGNVKLDDPLIPQILDPRALAFNNGRKFTWVSVNPGANTAYSISTHSAAFAPTGAGTNSNGSDADGSARTVATSAVLGSDATMVPSSIITAVLQRRHNPYLYGKFKLRDASGYRFWLHISDGSLLGTDSPTGNHVIGLRYSTVATDTTFKLVTANGAAATVTNTGVTASEDTLYEVELWEYDGAAFCRINNGNIITATATLATTTTSRAVVGYEMRSTTAGTEYGMTLYNLNFSTS